MSMSPDNITRPTARLGSRTIRNAGWCFVTPMALRCTGFLEAAWGTPGTRSKGLPGNFSETLPRLFRENCWVATQVLHRVAVIDDEKSIREMLQIGLSQEGFEVR